MRYVHFQPRARVDLLDIWNYIANDSPRAADRVRQRIEAAVQGLAEMPGKGHQRADVAGKPYRFWSVYSYLIMYRYDDLALTVVRIVHGKRNLRRALRSER